MSARYGNQLAHLFDISEYFFIRKNKYVNRECNHPDKGSPHKLIFKVRLRTVMKKRRNSLSCPMLL